MDARDGLVGEHGSSWLLPRLVGPAHALDLLLSGRVFLAEEAERIRAAGRAVAFPAMLDVLADRAPWYVVGLCLGLVVVGVMAFLGERTGAVGGYSEVVERVTRRTSSLGWRGWFLIGIVGGAAVFVLLGGTTPAADGYGWVTRTFDGSAAFLAAPVLFGAGALIGYGAKTAGGCTSGNGLCGSALGSPASLVATATFMATAVVLAFAIEAVVG